LTRKELKEWYNGYRFTRSNVKVYNPWSLFCALNDTYLQPYWINTGDMWNYLRDNYNNKKLSLSQNIKFFTTGMDVSRIDSTFTLEQFLYQTGYLTIDIIE